MLVRLCLLILLSTASGGLVVGCHSAPARPAHDAAAQATPPAKIPAPEKNSTDDLAAAHAHFSVAVLDELKDQPEQALAEYYAAALNDPGDATLVLEVSRRLVQEKQPEKALELLSRAAARPNSSGALDAQLGVIYSRLGKPDLAISASRAAIRKEPRLLDGYRTLFVTFLQNHKPQEGLAALEDAAKVSHTTPEFLVGLGELYANFGLQVPTQKDAAFARAFEILQRAEKSASTDPQLRFKLADAFNVIGKNDKAAEIYQDLVKRAANMPLLRDSLRARLADIYLRDREPKQAAEQLESMIRDNPTDPQAYYLLGGIVYDQGDYERAIDCFTKTLLLSPEFQPAYYDLAGAQIGANRNAEALETIDRLRRKFPESNRGFLTEYLSGMAFSRQKDFTNAVSHFTSAEIAARAGDTNQLTGSFYFQFGAACESSGQHAEAEKYFEKCLQLSPDLAEAQNYLGYMWADRGEKLDRARELIEKAVKAEPHNAAYLDSMGWVLFKLNRPQEALDYLLQAIKFSEEEDAILYDHLGDIYAALGQPGKARDAWQKSVAIEPTEQVRKKLESPTK